MLLLIYKKIGIVMNSPFSFYSIAPEDNGPSLYHTHIRCRGAQNVAMEARVVGTGEGRLECLFCFLLGQFQVNKALLGNALTGLKSDASAKQGFVAYQFTQAVAQ